MILIQLNDTSESGRQKVNTMWQATKIAAGLNKMLEPLFFSKPFDAIYRLRGVVYEIID